MKIGSIWESNNCIRFKVTDRKVVDNQTWIYYNNTSTRQEYSCLEEAFKSRFRELVNT